MCACCGVAHEILAALLLGFLQFICWVTVGQNCYSGGGWVSDKARLDKDMLKQLEKRNCDPPATGYEKMCEAYTFYPDMIDGAKAFCDAQSSVLAISAVSIIAALVLFFVAIANACKCCESCCGGKQRKSFLNVIFSAVGALIALIAWIIYLGLNSAYTKYRDGLADMFLVRVDDVQYRLSCRVRIAVRQLEVVLADDLGVFFVGRKASRIQGEI